MAILFSQADGSDQHYDTYEEFEQAFILLKRLNGEEVPQDLLDEVKTKNGDKEPKPFQVQIDGNNFESAISEESRKATIELAEALDEIAENRTPVSDEVEDPEKEPKFEVGDKVRVVKNLSFGHPEGTIGVISSVSYDELYNTHSYGIEIEYGNRNIDMMFHNEDELERAEDSPTEFRTGDIVKVTETFEDSQGDETYRGEILEYDDDWPKPFVGLVLVEDNHDKLRLVCRKEDRKDIEL